MEVDEESSSKDTLNLFSSLPASPARVQVVSAPEPTSPKNDEEHEGKKDGLEATCYVEIPKLNDEVLAKYHPIPGGWEAADKDLSRYINEEGAEETLLIEIVSEYTHRGTRYLYGLYADEILRKVSSSP